MLVLLGFSVIGAFLLRFCTPLTSAPLTEQLHQICVSACPSGNQGEFYRAIVCGARLTSIELKRDFAQIGLIHLLVVSGSHLVVLDSFTQFSILKKRAPDFRSVVSLSILFLFTLMTLASPPVLRAFLNAVLKLINARYLLSWSSLQITTVAGFLTLLSCHDAWDLCSLLLSWVAALALIPLVDSRESSAEQKAHAKTQSLAQNMSSHFWRSLVVNTKIYLLLLIPLSVIQIPHPATILMNLLFGPLLGVVLFPLSLSAVLIPPLSTLTDSIWLAVRMGVESLAHNFPTGAPKLEFPKELVVLHLGLLTLAFTAYRMRNHRSRFRDNGTGSSATRFAKLALSIGVSLAGLPRAQATQLVVWNVGQGSWATLVSETRCHHFDLGGEFAPWAKIESLCARKMNTASISHWDLDHISFVMRAQRALEGFCLAHRPLGSAPNRARELMFQKIPDCAADGFDQRSQGRVASLFKRASEMKTSNGRSQVFFAEGLLAPGDSGTHEERRWLHHPLVARSRVLLAGHHGSKTATSRALLKAAKNLKMVIASAREKKFGHPNQATRRRIADRRVPLLSTNDWGTLVIGIGGTERAIGPAPAQARANSAARH